MRNSVCLHSTVALLLIWVLVVSHTVDGHRSGLKVGYYRRTCPAAENIVRATVAKAVKANRGVAAGLIRMHFHDCFVRGCDGSILIDSTPGNKAEKDSPTNNPSLHGFEVIDEAKAKIEAKCPHVVSCADILAFAARDSAYQTGKSRWQVPAGRRDGRTSRDTDIIGNLPPPSFNVDQLTQNFAAKGLSQEDMVTLSGAHSLGVSHCSSFSSRLQSKSNGTLDPRLAATLRAKCAPQLAGISDPTVAMDSFTPAILDNKYYKGLLLNRGLFTSDQTLLTNPFTSGMVHLNSKNPSLWRDKFGSAMVRMGAIDVLTGSKGEIRRNCRIINSNYY